MGLDPHNTALQLDPVTGFLQSSISPAVTADTKVKILELLRVSGDLSSAARTYGIEPRVIRWHRANDPAFKKALEEVWEEIVDRAEGSVVKNFDKTPADRIFMLKTRRAAIYGDRVTQQHTHSVTLVQQLASRLESYPTEAIDGEK